MNIIKTALERMGIAKWDQIDLYPTEFRGQRSYILTDKHGIHYELWTDAEAPLEYLMWVKCVEGKQKGKRIADIQFGNVSRGEAELGMIEIYDNENRQKGLGTAMLRQVLEIARQCGIRSLTGFVTADGVRNTQGLLDWYRKEGFKVRPYDKTEGASLHMTL